MGRKQNPFVDWLFSKYLEYQQKRGVFTTQADFAKHMGITGAALSNYINGKRLPDVETIDKMAKILGDEVYEIVGLPEYDPRLRQIIKRWPDLSLEARQQLLNEVLTWTKETKP